MRRSARICSNERLEQDMISLISLNPKLNDVNDDDDVVL